MPYRHRAVLHWYEVNVHCTCIHCGWSERTWSARLPEWTTSMADTSLWKFLAVLQCCTRSRLVSNMGTSFANSCAACHARQIKMLSRVSKVQLKARLQCRPGMRQKYPMSGEQVYSNHHRIHSSGRVCGWRLREQYTFDWKSKLWFMNSIWKAFMELSLCPKRILGA